MPGKCRPDAHAGRNVRSGINNSRVIEEEWLCSTWKKWKLGCGNWPSSTANRPWRMPCAWRWISYTWGAMDSASTADHLSSRESSKTGPGLEAADGVRIASRLWRYQTSQLSLCAGDDNLLARCEHAR